MLGREPGTLVGEKYGTLFAGGKGPSSEVLDHEVFECQAITLDNRMFPVEIKLNRVCYDALPALAGVCRDITERVASARREIEHERLLVIGRMATVFAHEIRNSLSSIKVNVRILQRKLDLVENDNRRMAIILRDIDKLDKLLQDTLLFSRPLELTPRWYDINELLGKAVERFDALLRAAGISLEIELDGAVPRLKVDSSSMDIVFDNLISNAIQALQDSLDKRLTFSTRLRQNDGVPDMVEMVVSDSGCGMREDELELIFQPFYTTRENGIGLGLSNVDRVIEEHGGSISVVSQINRGTTFMVALPWQKESE